MAGYIGWLRGQVGPALLPIVFATAIVRDTSGRSPFQRRSDFGSAYAWWGLPGGLFEPGETPEGCLRREVLEEIPASQRRGRDLRIEPRRLTGVYSSARYRVTYPNGHRFVCSNGERLYPVVTLFACQAAGQAAPTARRQDRSAEMAYFDRAHRLALSVSEQVLAHAALTYSA